MSAANIPKAVQSGLQRHFTDDFKAQIEEMTKTGREFSQTINLARAKQL